MLFAHGMNGRRQLRSLGEVVQAAAAFVVVQGAFNWGTMVPVPVGKAGNSFNLESGRN